MAKVKTISLQGKDYARVADRVLEFRKDCPKGIIETSFTQLPDGQMVLKAVVTKEEGVFATGQSMGKVAGVKGFEKLESIAVGRALAFLGYAASGEIASSEEMQEFIDYQETKKQEAIDELESCESLDELRDKFMGLGKGLIANKAVIAKKNELKLKLK